MTAKEGVIVLNDEKEELGGGDPFDIFSLPVINTDYEKFIDDYVEPFSSITQDGPIVFKWQTLGGEKWDSSHMEVETTYAIMKGVARPTGADDVSVINSLPITHWDKIELQMNDKVVTNSSSGNHAYHAYLMQKSSYCKDVKKEILKRTECYFEDDPDHAGQYAFRTDTETSKIIEDTYKQKHNMFVKTGKDVVTRSQLYLDLTQVMRYYPSDIDYVLTLTRNPESFCLMTKSANAGSYKIVIKKIRLIVLKIIPSRHMIDRETHFLNTLKRKAYIPYTHTVLTDRLLPANTMTYTFRDVCGTLPSLPKQLFVFMVDHTAFAGK